MKHLIVCCCLLAGLVHASGGMHGVVLPEAKVTVRVVDEGGFPVTNANVGVGFNQDMNAFDGKHESETIRGNSDSNGLFSAQAKCFSGIGISVQKRGCYRSSARNDYPGTYQGKKRWEPWNPTNIVVLKEIKNPTSMYVESLNMGVPELNNALGFDLEKADWVAPYGKGVFSDFVFYAELDQKSSDDFDYKMTLTFPNEKDGIQTFEGSTLHEGSKLKSNHEAPEDGYLPEWKQFRKRRPKIGETNNIDQNRKFYFRIRTKLDEQGNIISALYGKIYGDFLQFTYYLNPKPNDRNVEFDPDENLFGGRDHFAP